MSFITKRERVFNDYDLFDLPARNEGKLKAYSSCTDARAWSHFCSDKSEHLVETIKRNNEVCRPKYVPTEAIVNTLLAHKQAEIARLKRKIEEFEQMVAAYDELELSCEQKCEIAKAHAAIKEANKDLNELWFDLDLSGYTGIDSEDFETGKSRGDEPSKVRRYESEETPRSKGDDVMGDEIVTYESYEWSMEKELIKTESKGNQVSVHKCICDKSTNVVDPRIQEMQDVIIAKDAKLSAMRNTHALIENDVCEPYCIYAHIYTALEKIFGILCQNDKYKLYLNLMTAGKDTRGIDIKGKILFKLKVLEKFSLALIAPCSREMQNAANPECSCYRAEVISGVETAYALTSSEIHKPIDNKRAQLVADIMENEEMKELLSKDLKAESDDEDEHQDDDINDMYNIDQENLKRLRNLQQNYDDLMNCYEALKHEKDCLQIRCRKYEELEKEFESLQTQLREYNSLWNEKEHYRKRSVDLDALKEQYLVLCDETTNIETALKAENEINEVRTKAIDELRCDNMELEKKLNEISIAFEKERNSAQCKLKESECKIMCQGQQIKSLSIQIDRLLEQDPDKLQSKHSEAPAIALIDEINSLKDQIKNLQDALYCSEEEKQQLQEEYQNKLNQINDLKMEIEDWKSNYEKTLQRNEYLEKYTDSFRDEVHKLIEENNTLKRDVDEKSNAIDNLINVLNNKSVEVNKLMEDIENKDKKNRDLYAEINNLHDTYNKSVTALDSEKMHVMRSLQTAKKESQELLEKVRDYDVMVAQQENLSHLYDTQTEEYNQLKALLISTQKQNEALQMELNSRHNDNSILLQKIQRLKEANDFAVSSLQDENNHYKMSLELTKTDSKLLVDRLHSLEDLSYQFQQLKESHENLIKEKCRLENELANKSIELDNAIHAFTLKKKESQELEIKLRDSENLQTDFMNVESTYKKLVKDHQRLQSEFDDKKEEFDRLLESYNNLKNNLKIMSDRSSEEVEKLTRELNNLKNSYNELSAEKNALQTDLDGKGEEINSLYNNLENKIEENKELSERLQLLEHNNRTVQNNISNLQEEHYSTSKALNALRKESDELMDRVKFYETIESKYDKLKKEHDLMKGENHKLLKELDTQKEKLRRIAEDNEALNSESRHLFTHCEDLERAVIIARTELITKSSSADLQTDIMKQIEQMKKEKYENAVKIRNLLDKLDESENIISDLHESVLGRDDKIAILENHINELQDEVKRLHKSLEEMVETGEQIQDISQQKITESLDTMEAHHSKAAHNMKMEMAKLQSDNMKLEERLSIHKIKSEESARTKHKYMSQIIHLQNEREIIITDIKQLELTSVGDSTLSPEHCSIEDILGSLDRIRRYVDARSSKSTSLEQTLLKVQSSYQVVQSKADEAKKIVEKEKQKIMNEKEDAVRDRIKMEKQLTDLREQLEKQVSHDKNVITDLEAEILNQKLICDKLNRSTQSYISKLKEEMLSLQGLYQTSLQTISELEKRVGQATDEKNAHLEVIEKVNMKLMEKSEEIELLRKDLEKLKNKSSKNTATQVITTKRKDNEAQTSEEFLYEGYDKYEDSDKTKTIDEESIENDVTLERKIGNFNKAAHATEVQVLVANVEPTFDYVRNSYLNYKLKNLSHGRLMQYSTSCTSTKDTEMDTTKDLIIISEIDQCEGHFTNGQSIENMNVIDIYNKQSMHTNSSKIIDSNYYENERDTKSPGKSSAITDFGLTVESFETKNSIHKASNLFGSVSGISTDKDLFVIYKDSDTNNKEYDKKTWQVNGNSGLLVETVTIHPDRYIAKSKRKQFDVENDTFSYQEGDELIEDDSVKNKLKINLPRVQTDTPSILDVISSDGEKKSLDSYTIIKDSISNDEDQYLNSNVSHEKTKLRLIINKKQMRDMNSSDVLTHDFTNENTSPSYTVNNKTFEGNSHHRLSRTDADVRLIKSKTGHTVKDLKNSKNYKQAINFGLDFIHATADNINSHDAADDTLRKTRSDEMFGKKVHETHDSNQSRSTDLRKSSTDNDQLSSIVQSKVYVDEEVMVRLDPIEEYEMQIKHLTHNLENLKKDYKKKIEVIKIQYDTNIKSILNEHNEGVKSIQGLHEETLQDIIKHHDNEVENLRTMSIEAMRKADKLEKEVRSLKHKMPICSSTCLSEDPAKISAPEFSKQRQSRIDTKTLTKTNVEAFNVRPKSRSNGPCTCSLDINISDTIRNIFEQVDVDQRKIAEQMYLKYIANKILNNTVEALDCQELSFLHLKVCRIWKVKSSKEETLQKRISSLEAEVINKQRHNQHNIAELDRQVAEERRRLQEVREAVCRNAPSASRYIDSVNQGAANTTDVEYHLNIDERKSAGDLAPVPAALGAIRQKKVKPESNRAVLAKLDGDERREKKLYNDEPPTRLRRPHDRYPPRPNKK